ncbi:hypothetical protein MKW98_001353 [Papaver atlanticum]|uniref:Uncharacterized protein n=1 Tax=Papaver atlanticum TaxID=357466 RepID=A0AAD4XIG0_9MAGN|nr:hypothetical protein MKW98_001353 [Papaver atlanticum]
MKVLDETMLDNDSNNVPHSDNEEIDEYILAEYDDTVETSNHMTTDYILPQGSSKQSSDYEIRKRIIHFSKEGYKQRH